MPTTTTTTVTTTNDAATTTQTTTVTTAEEAVPPPSARAAAASAKKRILKDGVAVNDSIYPKVGVKDGARFDVVVQTMSAYQRLDGLDEGCSGDLMSFGVAAGTSVDLQISFRNSETGDAMGPLPLFYLSAFDIDGAPLTSFALGGGGGASSPAACRSPG